MVGKIFKRILCGVIAGSLLVGITGCKAAEPEKSRYAKVYYDYFDTVTTIVGYEENEQTFLDKCDYIEEELDRFNKLFDIYHAYKDVNNLYTINKEGASRPVEVDEDLIRLLEFCREMYDITDGKTNFAMGSVLSIWHDYREEGSYDPALAKVPPMEDLQAASEHCNPEDVVIDSEHHTVYIQDPQLKIDVGAIGKGYAAERIAQELIEDGTENYTLNLGGNIRTIGTKIDGTDWIAGVQNPDMYTSEEEFLLRVHFSDKALVTSGTYQRYYYVGNTKYHHIIDPDTLMPKNDFVSVSILSPDSGAADALSTACFNMSLEDGRKLINSLENTEAMWVDSDGTISFSDGFESYVVEEKE